MAVKFYLEKRPSVRTGECAIRASFSIKGVKLITTTGMAIKDANWSAEKAVEERNEKGRRKSPVDYKNVKGQTCKDINDILDKVRMHFSEWERTLEEKPSSDQIRKELKKAMNKKTPVKEVPVRVKRVSFFDRLDEFTREEGAANGWAYATHQCWKTFKHHMEAFNPKVKFEFFNESGINKFVIYLRNLDLEEKSVTKQFNNLRWFMYWALRKGYTTEDTIKRYRPKFKLTDKPIIFLTKEELLQLYHYQIPKNGTKLKLINMYGEEYETTVEDAGGLAKARDCFCFCAFTSLRYSDMANLRRTDIDGDTMYITTVKTYDRLPINLNKFAKEILEKYKDFNFPDNLALPVLPNQLMNRYLKKICEYVGFNQPITRIAYKGGERVEETKPKCEMIGTHAGRRTFICFALASGIPPQVVMKWTGHSDYQAMKPYIEIAEKTKADAMKTFEDAMSE